MTTEIPVKITMSQPESVGSERRRRLPPMAMGRIMEALGRTTYTVAATQAERDAIFRLRHEAYVREGAIRERPDGLFRDAVDDHPNCLHVGVFVDGHLAGAIRLNVTVEGLPPIPTAGVFPDCLEAPIAEGRTYVDPTRFVSDWRWTRSVPDLMYLTLRVPWMATAFFGADAMLAAVRPEHFGFYRRMWGNVMVSPPRLYPGLAKPVLLSELDFWSARERVEAELPFFRERPGEAASLFAGCGLDPVSRRSPAPSRG